MLIIPRRLSLQCLRHHLHSILGLNGGSLQNRSLRLESLEKEEDGDTKDNTSNKSASFFTGLHHDQLLQLFLNYQYSPLREKPKLLARLEFQAIMDTYNNSFGGNC